MKMITGDHLLIATETAKLLNLGDKVPGSDVVLPVIRTAVGKFYFFLFFCKVVMCLILEWSSFEVACFTTLGSRQM